MPLLWARLEPSTEGALNVAVAVLRRSLEPIEPRSPTPRQDRACSARRGGQPSTGMSMDETRRASGCGFASLLTILFIGLKLTGYIEWSWWWVLSPMWIGFAFVLLAIVVVLAIAMISDIRDNRRRR